MREWNLKTVVLPASPESAAEGGRLLAQGELVAFPTETVYGLGADATDDKAVASIFEAKGRPQFNPLIAHIPDLSWAEGFAEVSDVARRLARRFWPGPMTLVMKRKAGCAVSYLVSAGLDSVAVRLPSHPFARALIEAAGVPVAAPSANISGTVSPTTAGHVLQGLGGRISMLIDGGACPVGVESTVLDVRGDRPVLLRAGGLTVEEIETETGKGSVLFPDSDPALPRSPGQLSSHYAPSIPVRLNADKAEEGEALLGFGKVENAVLNLSPSGDLNEAAAHLFAYMRELDRMEFKAIAVSPVPMNDLGLAINDRLKRAAYPRH